VAACRVLLRALSLSNNSSIIGSCDERGSVCSRTPIRAGARPAERVAGQCRAPGEQSTQPVRRCCPALAGAKPAGTTDSPHSTPAAQLAHALRGAPVINETAPARHRHRSRPSGRTVLTHHPIPDQLSSSSRHFRGRSLNDLLGTSGAGQANRRAMRTPCESLAVNSAPGTRLTRRMAKLVLRPASRSAHDTVLDHELGMRVQSSEPSR
jgi:hypothetical protein